MRNFSGPRGREGAFERNILLTLPALTLLTDTPSKEILALVLIAAAGLAWLSCAPHCYARHLQLLKNSFRYKSCHGPTNTR
jgi:hypothetical protein